MYSPAFHTMLIDARIEDLRRGRGTSAQAHRSREARSPRSTTLFARLRRSGIRRLQVADASSLTGSQRS
jgi:hypothetical protein